jgi:SAM-dependent methyltransferase
LADPTPPPRDRPPENADVDSSSEAYARRFAGPVGRWFLELQSRLTLAALAGLPAGASVLDVGGGHAQAAPTLIKAGYRVTVAGSEESCGARLRPWTSTGRCVFRVADLQRLPFPDRSFEAVVCYRLLAHSVDWHGLIRELCRVSAHRVVADYPSRRSMNAVSERLFGLKRSIEGSMTRPYAMYRPREIADAFARSGFAVSSSAPQFFIPMVVHRVGRSSRLGRVLEWPARTVGLTRLLGSPIIVRADRRHA